MLYYILEIKVFFLKKLDCNWIASQQWNPGGEK